jgi:hypothetical protein
MVPAAGFRLRYSEHHDAPMGRSIVYLGDLVFTTLVTCTEYGAFTTLMADAKRNVSKEKNSPVITPVIHSR